MREVGRYIDEVAKISLGIQKEKGKKLADFRKGLKESKEIEALADEVNKFASSFAIPGFDPTTIDIDYASKPDFEAGKKENASTLNK